MTDSPTCGIQEAIDALGPAGGVVHIPAGCHLLRRAIRLRDGVTLRGQGPATVLTRPAPVFADLRLDTLPNQCDIQIDSSSGFAVGDQVRLMDDLQPMYHSRELLVTEVGPGTLRCSLIYGEPQRVYRVVDHGWVGNLFPAITASRVRGVTLECLTIDGGDWPRREDRGGDFLGAAVHTFKCQEVRIRDITVRRWPADGISVQDGSALVSGCLVEDCLGSGLHPGSKLAPSVWTGNIARRNRDGFFFCSTVRHAVVSGNVLIDNRRHGVWGLGDPDRANVLAANVVARNGGHGLEAQRAHGNVVVANLFDANGAAEPGKFAQVLLHEHRHNLVASNLILSDGAPASPGAPGAPAIQCDQPCDANHIAGNAQFTAAAPSPKG